MASKRNGSKARPTAVNARDKVPDWMTEEEAIQERQRRREAMRWDIVSTKDSTHREFNKLKLTRNDLIAELTALEKALGRETDIKAKKKTLKIDADFLASLEPGSDKQKCVSSLIERLELDFIISIE